VEGGRGKGKEGFEDSRVQVIMFQHFLLNHSNPGPLEPVLFNKEKF